MNVFIDTGIHAAEINKIKRDKSHLIDLVEAMLRTELPEICTYAELIRKARKIGAAYRVSFKMSHYEFKLFRHAIVSVLQEKQFRQFKVATPIRDK